MKRKSLILTLLIGQTFLWTGSTFMAVLYRLYAFYEPAQAALCTEGLYYIMQAAGIAAYALLLRRRPAAGGRHYAALAVAATGVFTALALSSGSGPVVLIAGALMNLCVGQLSGLYLTRLSAQIAQQHRGRVFGYSYAIGSVGTYLLTLPWGGRLLQAPAAVYVFLAFTALSVFLTRYLEPLVPGGAGEAREDSSRPDRRLIITALCVPLVCSLAYGMGGYLAAADVSDILSAAFTRAFYAVGLIAAGYINDKNRRYGAVCCAVAPVFPFISLALAQERGAAAAVSALSYVFYGFFSVYRVVLFADIAGKRASLLFTAVFGLMAGRVGDAAGTLAGLTLGGSQVWLTAVTAAVFVGGLLVFFALYQRLYMPLPPERTPAEPTPEDYEAHYGFTSRQCEIFRLVLGGASNAEISAALYLSESTVKFYMRNILKRTGCANRTELVGDYRTGEWRGETGTE